jgi:hypothetical protein
VFLGVKTVKSKIKDMNNDIQGSNPEHRDNFADNNSKTNKSKNTPRNGDYIDFEEIK